MLGAASWAQRMRPIARVTVALAVVWALSSVVRARRPDATQPSPPASAVDSSFVTVEGFAYWDAARGLRPTAVLRVRLIDLKGTERGSVVAATSQPLPQAQHASAWMLRVPTAHRHVADDGLLVVSIDDGDHVRYVGTQATRAASTVGAALRRSGPRPAPPSVPSGVTRWIQLHAVPAGGG